MIHKLMAYTVIDLNVRLNLLVPRFYHLIKLGSGATCGDGQISPKYFFSISEKSPILTHLHRHDFFSLGDFIKYLLNPL